MIADRDFCRLRVIAVFPLFFLLLALCAPKVVFAYTKESYTSVQRAEESISSAFKVVLEAEEAGANVSILVTRLNEAVNSLVEAKVFFKNGDFDKVVEVAGRSVEVAEVVKDEALRLKMEALSHRDFVLKVSLMGSGIGVPAFLLFTFFLWRHFKAYYIRRVLRMKLEVSSDVEA